MKPLLRKILFWDAPASIPCHAVEMRDEHVE